MTTNLTIFVFLGVTLRDPGFTNVRIVECTLRDLDHGIDIVNTITDLGGHNLGQTIDNVNSSTDLGGCVA